MGRRKQLPRPEFALGDFVFAKVCGYRAWPARVVGRHGARSNIKYNVLFYGTCNTAKISPKQIFGFENNQQRLGVLPVKRTARNVDFCSAMAHVRRAFASPESDFMYFQVLGKMENDSSSTAAYEMLSSTTEQAEDQGSNTDVETISAEREEPQEPEEIQELTMDVNRSSEDREERQHDTTMSSMPLLNDTNDDLDESGTSNNLENKENKRNSSIQLFSGNDSSSFEFEGNPIVRDRSHLEDLSPEPVPRLLQRNYLNLLDDSSEESDGDQPSNQCSRHITADEE